MRLGITGAAAWLMGTVALAYAGEPAAKSSHVPTYTKDVAPILQQRCQGCHRKGEVAPFVLESYEQARKRSRDIASVAESREMPPWKPAAGVGPRLKHDKSLTPAEVSTLREWAAAGAPRGADSVASPSAAVSEPGEWPLGTPDLVIEATEEFSVPATGADLYRCFVIPSGLKQDAAVSAVVYKPGNRRVVHHMMAFIDTAGNGRERDREEPGPGYMSYSGAGVDVTGDLGGWAAGNVPDHLPEGVGRILPARSDVILQVHYHPTGKPEVDRPRIGFYFCKKPVKQTLQWANATNDQFRLPAGRSRIEVKATWFVPVDVEALAITPHLHALGREFRMTVTYPDGRTKDLLHIPDWDPAWQETYFFEKPVSLPKRSTVRVIVIYDNSSHDRNPNRPPRNVTWGPSASDEMCVGYIGVVKKGQDLTRPGEADDLYEILSKQTIKKVHRERSLGLRN